MSKKKRPVKWAQMTKEQRYWKLIQDPTIKYDALRNKCFSLEQKRKRNRYIQLLNHWCKLRKELENDPKSYLNWTADSC